MNIQGAAAFAITAAITTNTSQNTRITPLRSIHPRSGLAWNERRISDGNLVHIFQVGSTVLACIERRISDEYLELFFPS
jgi:hypothetical protein